MSKWENSFKKIITDTEDDGSCKCSSLQGLFVPNRQLSAMVAGLLCILFFVFIAGYFMGKKSLVEEFTKDMYHGQENSLRAHGEKTRALSDSENKDKSSLVTCVDQNIDSEPVVDMPIVPETVVTINQDIDLLTATDESRKYYAQLIGFGTEKAAQQFVKKLSLNGINTEVKKRISKTVKGRTSYWYQVVTAAYSDKNDLSRVVDRLVKEEKLRDVCIRVC